MHVFYQEDCLIEHMRHSNATAAKALFIKKLSVVWAVLPQFTHKNTVIIDDISEKFDCNPPENCIVVSLLAPALRHSTPQRCCITDARWSHVHVHRFTIAAT